MIASVVGVLRRWWAGRLLIVATGVLAVALIAITTLEHSVSVQTSALLDANWRGAYDILVTPLGEDFGGAHTDGLVDSNFVATGGRRAISSEQLSGIRAIDGVEVAAPIGMVGVLRDVAHSAQLYIPDNHEAGESGLPAEPVLVRISPRLRRTTALGTQEVWRSSGVVAISRQDGGFPGLDPGAELPSFALPGGFAPQFTNLAQQIAFGGMPAFAATVIAVDPVAEQRLLGGSGRFLTPLLDAPDERRADELPEHWASMEMDASRYAVQQAAVSYAQHDPAQAASEIVPMIVNTATNASLTLDVAIERAPEPLEAIPQDRDAMERLVDKSSFDDWETVSRDVSDLPVPFSSPGLGVLWPGSSLPEGEDGGFFSVPATSLDPALIGRPDYERLVDSPAMGDVPAYRVVPKGVVGPDGQPVDPDDPLYADWGVDPGVGLVPSYRTLIETEGPDRPPALPAPLGAFDSDALDFDMDAAGYVPLGAYDPARTTLFADADGWRVDERAVSPSLSGLDFITGPPGAITDLVGGATLRGDAPIDAIRVRVGGIDSYTPTAQQRVNEVAAEISGLGLGATVVAGSSPQPVAIFVPDYHLDEERGGGDLGWVRQEWTTLGAAAIVSEAMTALQKWLAALGLGTAGAGLLATAVLGGRRKRHDVAVLRTVGWTEPQIGRRLVNEQLPNLGILLVVAAGCAALGAHGRLTAPVLIAGVIAAIVAVAAGTAGSMTRGRRPRPHRRPGTGIASPRALALRQLASAPTATGFQVVGLVVLAASTAATTAAISAARDASGPTRLAGLVIDSTTMGTVLLGLSGALAATILAVLGQRADLLRRSGQWSTLQAIGIDRRILHGVLRWETAILGVVSLAVGLGVAMVLTERVGASSVAVLAAGAAVVIGTAISGLGKTKAVA